jgi:hypothetical protein
MHLQALGVLAFRSDHALQFTLHVVTLIMIVIRGCVIPAFTANALPKVQVRRLAWADVAAIGLVILVLVIDLFPSLHAIAGPVALPGGGEHHPYVALAVPCHTASAVAVDSAPRLCMNCRCPCPERTRRRGIGGNAQCGHSCVDRRRDRQSDAGHDEPRGAGSHRPRYRGVNRHDRGIYSHKRQRDHTCGDTYRSTGVLRAGAHRSGADMDSCFYAVCHRPRPRPHSDATQNRRKAKLSVCQCF